MITQEIIKQFKKNKIRIKIHEEDLDKFCDEIASHGIKSAKKVIRKIVRSNNCHYYFWNHPKLAIAYGQSEPWPQQMEKAKEICIEYSTDVPDFLTLLQE